MGKRTYSAALSLFMALMIVGCGNEKPSFSLLPDQDVFYQDLNSKTTASKIDILWVVDNSGSMETSQTNVANNFQSFIENFQTKDMDFQIAVTTTEAYKSFYGHGSSWSRFRDGTDSTSHTGEFVLTPLTSMLTDTFMINIQQGINGNGNERAFQSFREALNNPNNSGFVRSDGFLSIVIVSDEDDFSRDSQAWSENYNVSDIHPVQDYVDYLDQLTNSTEDVKKYSVSAMAIFDEDCRDELNLEWTGRKIGIRYGELVDATGGVKGSLCGDFASELDVVSENILSLATQFYLSRIPIVESIVVKLDGQIIPNTATNPGPLTGGWEYVSETNSVVFKGDYIPQAGAQIQVDFDPVSYGG
ncbi:MAG: VWA domain-containing protein [Bdellovibrionales bacterium]|nr:VWA domain-containing protein [Bdellovibrionales bacterium]